ncbi:MAG: F0F1 ATP synthase subunit B [Sporichthyaceae bacterium]
MTADTLSHSTGATDLILAAGAKGSIIEGIGFIFVIAILGRYILPLVGKAMAARQEAIAKQLADAESAGMKLAEAQAAYDAAVAKAKAEAEEMVAEAREQHAKIVSEAAAAARARAEEITARARETLEAERIQAVKSLQAEIAALAVGQAEQAVHTSLADDARQRRVIDRFITELESGRVASGDTTSTGGRS